MYVDAKLIGNRLWVNERDANHNRTVASHTPRFVYYYADSAASHHSIYGDPVRRAHFTSRREFEQSITQKRSNGVELFETDYNPVFRYLEEVYVDDNLPPIHATFFDIEVEVDPARGWPRPTNPYGRVTAVTLHNVWEDRTYTLVVPPKNHTVDSLRGLFETDAGDGFGVMDADNGYHVCDDEKQLLDIFIELIEDSDLILGWNSDGFDLPYLIHRIRMVFGNEFPEQFESEQGTREAPMVLTDGSKEALHRLTLFPCPPTLRMVEKKNKFNNYRTFEKNYFLHGRVHLDYMSMFQKFTLNTLGKLHSYRLDFVLRSQLNDSKLEYDGSLQELYENNPRRYAAYNRQDTMGPVRLDKKFKLVDLANRLAHMAGVTLDKTLGAVSIIEHAIMKQVAHKNKLVRRDKVQNPRHETIPGAFVVEPRKGLYNRPFTIDVMSLYPSAARMLNISPETLVGQFLPTLTSPAWNKLYESYGGATNDKASTRAWSHFTGVLEYEEILKQSDVELTLSLSDGSEVSQSAKEWYEFIREAGLALSGNATLFSQEKRGIFSGAIDLWFDERVKAKGKMKKTKARLAKERDPDKKALLDLEYNMWDTLQMAFKIFMNSAYGASGNVGFAFYDTRAGKSITLSGRVITKHMIKQACKEITGNYDFDRDALIYGDTDSVMCRMDWFMKEKLRIPDSRITDKKTIWIANGITARVNKTFPELLKTQFFCTESNSKFISANRDVVAVRGLFKDKKKRYAMWVIDKEGNSEDEIKIVGMESRRTNTPKYMQKFLEDLVGKMLRENLNYDQVYAIANDFRENHFDKMDPWKYGSSMNIKNLEQIAKMHAEYDEQMNTGYVGLKKPPPGSHAIKAAINTNAMIEQFKDNRWDKIREGDSVEVLYLLPNPNGYDKVALPVGSAYIPEWFKQLPFDTKRNQAKILDSALHNMVGEIMDWDFSPVQNTASEVFVEQDFFS